MARNRKGPRSKGAGPSPDQRNNSDSLRNRIRVISGGQTGVDRGVLDAALDLNIQCGGWCPEGRLAEDGVIPEQYPLEELAGGDYRDRTRKNVVESDGSAIIYFGEIEGGTECTLDDCVQLAKPYQLIDGAGMQPGQAAKQIAEFVRERNVHTLNIAGPRASKIEKGHKFAFDTVRMLVDLLGQKRPSGGKRTGNRSSNKQRSNGQPQQGTGNGGERGGKARNPQFNSQRRKGAGQHHRPRQGQGVK
ncbi:MAG: putative molybdenum carrier protein [Burkholderiales bacterium]